LNKELSGVKTRSTFTRTKWLKGIIVQKSRKETGEYMIILKFVVANGKTFLTSEMRRSASALRDM